MRAKKIKYKQERIELRCSEMMKAIIDKEIVYRNSFRYNNNNTVSKLIREALARYIINNSTNWHNYTPAEQDLIRNYFKD